MTRGIARVMYLVYIYTVCHFFNVTVHVLPIHVMVLSRRIFWIINFHRLINIVPKPQVDLETESSWLGLGVKKLITN
jgi:hypothetical protein